MNAPSQPRPNGRFTEPAYFGVPIEEIAGVAELLNDIDLDQRQAFGDIVSSVIVRNVKSADLKNQQVSVRGLARVVGVQPATMRRRIEQLIGAGWLSRDETGIHYAPRGLEYGAPASRRTLLKMAGLLRQLGWGDFHPPEG